MNISNIIITLQEKLSSTTESLDLMTYSKIIEKLQVGSVAVVPTFFDLPDLDNDGNIFLVESEQELYYNVGTLYKSLGKIGTTPTLSWGSNNFGRLGDGTSTRRSSPVTVVGEITNWSQVSAGGQHSLGVTNDGIAYGWGYNGQSQLGDGSNYNNSSLSPVTVTGGITNWSQVSAGSLHSLGVTDSGIAYGWGNTSEGKIGATLLSFAFNSFQDTADYSVNVQQFFGGVSDLNSVGFNTNMGFINVNGNQLDSVFNTLNISIFNSQLNTLNIVISNLSDIGSGVTDINSMVFESTEFVSVLSVSNFSTSPSAPSNLNTPAKIDGNITNWSQVSAGSLHSLGVTDSGIAYAWGDNGAGRLGDGTTTDRSSPVTVIGGITDWTQVSAGYNHSLGVTDSGIAYAWGYNLVGQIGDGSQGFSDFRSSPVTVVGGINNWSQVSAGPNHSLGVTDSGIAYAWGDNGAGRLGDGTTTDRSSPVTVIGGITNWSQVSATGSGAFNVHSLGLTDNGIAYGWGSNNNGQLGDGTLTSRSSPVTVVGGITNWSQVSAGDDHSLGVFPTTKSFNK